MSDRMDREIRQVVSVHAHLAVDVDALGERENLHRLGMTSYANVNVMLALEEAFDIEFPEEMLSAATFESLAAIRAAVSELIDEPMTASLVSDVKR